MTPVLHDLFNDTETPGELHGKLDAILRDQNAPADVRTLVTQVLALDSYASANEFSTDDNGYVTVVPRTDAPADVSATDAPATTPADVQPNVNEQAGTAPGPDGAAANPGSEATVPGPGEGA